ncbi:MAG TPA: nuclear transport factor 2 family protein [Pyrinomonadaceae bacterium]|nr:nuclear transport factor 2 family protein [Pyrinomonadaceae bacterium]
MKRCSTCNRTYTDPNLSFCIDDGTPLTTVNAEEESTVVSPRDNQPAVYQPPSYVPPAGTEPTRRRRMWPWVVGLLGAFLLGIIAISIAAAIFAPRLLRSRQNERPVAANTNRSENTNRSAPVNSNANVNESADVPPPTNHEEVLGQLTNLEQEWTIANLKADKEALDRILADDYVGQPAEGRGLETKADYLRTIQPNRDIEKWEFSNLNLSLIGDRATLTGTIRYELRDREVVYTFKDKFVWRDGRWQATGSEVTPTQSL